MRRRKYASGFVNPFLPTEAYEAQRKAMLEGTAQIKERKTKPRDDRVVQIRINPLDCVSIVDYMDKIGESTVNMSFAQCVKIVLASAIETFRRANYLPIPDGTTYLEKMDRFGEASTRLAMLNITDQGNKPAFQVKPLFEDPAIASRRRKYEELMINYRAAPESFDAMEELAELMVEFQ